MIAKWVAVSPLFILLKVNFQTIRNNLRFLVRSGIYKLLGFSILGLGFLLFDYFFFARIFNHLQQVDIIGQILAIRLLSMVFLTFFTMLIFSNITAALSNYYLNEELFLLYSLPLKVNRILSWKFIQTCFQSSFLILLFGLPILLAYGISTKAGFLYYLTVILVLPPFLILPAGLGSIITIILASLVSPRKAHAILLILSVLGLAAVVITLRMLKPEQLLQPVNSELIFAYLNTFRIPSPAYLPSSWVSEILADTAHQGRISGSYFRHLSLLYGTSLITILGFFSLAGKFYFQSWSKAGDLLYKKTKSACGDTAYDLELGSLYKFLRFLPMRLRILIFKEIKLFLREAVQWSQLILLLALLVVYLFNIYNLPLPHQFLKNVVCFLNLGLAGFVLAALCVRFVFPAVSLEGGCIWLIRTLPMNLRTFLSLKYCLYLVPLALLSIALAVFSNLILKVDIYMMWVSIATLVLMVAALTGLGLGLGLGAAYPRFDIENPAQIAMTSGGILFMVLSLVLIGLTVSLEARPVYSYLYLATPWRAFRLLDHGLFFITVLILDFISVWIPFRYGEKILSQKDL